MISLGAMDRSSTQFFQAVFIVGIAYSALLNFLFLKGSQMVSQKLKDFTFITCQNPKNQMTTTSVPVLVTPKIKNASDFPILWENEKVRENDNKENERCFLKNCGSSLEASGHLVRAQNATESKMEDGLHVISAYNRYDEKKKRVQVVEIVPVEFYKNNASSCQDNLNGRSNKASPSFLSRRANRATSSNRFSRMHSAAESLGKNFSMREKKTVRPNKSFKKKNKNLCSKKSSSFYCRNQKQRRRVQKASQLVSLSLFVFSVSSISFAITLQFPQVGPLSCMCAFSMIVSLLFARFVVMEYLCGTRNCLTKILGAS